MILEKIYDWNILRSKVGNMLKPVEKLWESAVYPSLISKKDKIAGSMKWSSYEDDILINFSKIKP